VSAPAGSRIYADLVISGAPTVGELRALLTTPPWEVWAPSRLLRCYLPSLAYASGGGVLIPDVAEQVGGPLTPVNAVMQDGDLDDIVPGAGLLTWPDWLGWLVGAVAQPGDTTPPGVCRYVSPASIPLSGVTWEQVRRELDRSSTVDRWAGVVGSEWAGHRVWRVHATMHEWALDALVEGHALRGRVRVECGVEDIDGQIVGVEAVRWLGDDLRHAEVQMTIATEDPSE
jgi:hypothetical protein